MLKTAGQSSPSDTNPYKDCEFPKPQLHKSQDHYSRPRSLLRLAYSSYLPANFWIRPINCSPPLIMINS